MQATYVPDISDDRVIGCFALVEDISERKQIEESLRESEERYRSLAEALPQFVWTRDASGEINYINRHWKEYFGLTLEDAKGGAWRELVHPEDLPRLEEAARLRAEGKDIDLECRFQRASDGAFRWHLVRGFFVPGAQGETRWIATATDIEDRKRTEEELWNTAHRFRLALKNAPVSVFEQDRQLRYTWAHNESPIFRPELLLGKSDEELNPGPWIAEVTAAKRRILETGVGERHEFTIPVAGEDRVYDMTLEPLRDTDGNITGISAAAVNITERKRTEQDLRRREEEWRFLANALPQFIWVSDLEGNIQFLNRYWFDYTGLPEDGAWSEDRTQVVDPEDLAATYQAWFEARQTGREATFEYRVKRASDGVWRWHLGIFKPEHDQNGRVQRWVGVGIDIHDRREAENRTRLLAESGIALVSSLNYEETLRAVARLAVPTFADWSAVDLIDERQQIQRVAVEHSDPARVEFAHEFHRRYPSRNDDATWQAIRTGKSFFLADIPDALIEDRARDPEHARMVRELNVRSFIVAPMVAHGRVLGVLTFATAESGRRYTQSDVALAEDLAHRGAMAIDNARLHAAVQSNEARLRLLFDTAGEGICLCNLDGRAVLANPRAAELFGCSQEELTGRSLFDFIPEEAREIARSGFHRRAEGDMSAPREYPVRRNDGTVRWLRVFANVLRDRDGKVDGVLGMFSDVTELRAAIEELRASERRFRELANAVPAFVWTTDPGGSLTFLNDPWYAYTGLTPEQSIATGWASAIAPEDQQRVLAAWEDARQREMPYTVETRYRSAQGEYRWFMARAVPIRDEEGRIVQWYGTSTDIHEAKRAEEELSGRRTATSSSSLTQRRTT